MTNLKYDFIDEDHKRMHNALIQAGWSCKNDTITFSCKDTLWEWVYKKGKEAIFFSNINVDVFHRDIDDEELCFYEESFSEVADIIEAELKGILGTNADQPVQSNEMVDQPVETHDQMEYHPITKDNIVEVLEYNNFKGYYKIFTNDCIDINYDDNSQGDTQSISFSWKNWLQHLELEIGKLKPLPKPRFDFVQYLLDNGFKTEETLGNICIRKEMFTIGFNVINKSYYYKDKKIQPTEANAKIVVEMAKLSEGLS